MKKLLTSILAILIVIGCDVNDSDSPESFAFTITIENISTAKEFIAYGVFNTPKGTANRERIPVLKRTVRFEESVM